MSFLLKTTRDPVIFKAMFVILLQLYILHLATDVFLIWLKLQNSLIANSEVFQKGQRAQFNTKPVIARAATILRLLGNKTIQFNTRGKQSEPGLRKQLNTDVKSTTKFFFLNL